MALPGPPPIRVAQVSDELALVHRLALVDVLNCNLLGQSDLKLVEDAPADVLEVAPGVALEDEPENSSEDLPGYVLEASLVDAPEDASEDSNPVASHEH